MTIDETFLAQGTPDDEGGETPSRTVDEMKGPSVWRRFGLQIGILGVGAIIWILFLVAAPDVFTSADIYRAFASTTPLFLIMALALTFVVITGEIDLSFPSVMALSMVSFIFVIEHGGFIGVAFLAALATGAIAGMINGFLVGKMGIPAVVITIGTSFLFRGLELAAMSGRGVSLTDPAFDFFKTILVGRIFFGIPMQFVWTIVLAVLLWALLNRTRFGAHVYLIGDNATSARLMGVNLLRTRMGVFMLMGTAAAFAGMVASFEVSYFWPTLGDGSLLTTISSVFVGGTSVFGGTGSILGTFIGGFIIGALNAGIVSAGINAFWTQAVFGLVIVVSVVMQTIIMRRVRR
jgi:simple sugar transport system permease protein